MPSKHGRSPLAGHRVGRRPSDGQSTTQDHCINRHGGTALLSQFDLAGFRHDGYRTLIVRLVPSYRLAIGRWPVSGNGRYERVAL